MPRWSRSSARGCVASSTVDELRLRVRVYLHEGLDLDVAEAFWADGDGCSACAVRCAVPGQGRSEHPSRQARAWMCVRALLLFSHASGDHGPHPRAAILKRHSGVAQLAEQRPVKPTVAGSSPAPGALVSSGSRGIRLAAVTSRARSCVSTVDADDPRGRFGDNGRRAVGSRASSRRCGTQYEPLRRFAAVIGRWDVEPDDLVQEAYAKVL